MTPRVKALPPARRLADPKRGACRFEEPCSSRPMPRRRRAWRTLRLRRAFQLYFWLSFQDAGTTDATLCLRRDAFLDPSSVCGVRKFPDNDSPVEIV